MSATAEIKKVACYYRVSTSDQAQRGTIENQKFKCRTYCDQQGYEIVKEFDDPAVSGTITIRERPNGKLLMQAIDDKAFDALVVVHTDRLTRGKLKEFGEIFGTLEESEICLISIDESGMIDPTEMVGQFSGFISSRFAKKYRDDQLEKQQDGRYRASREGRYAAGQINYGMDTDEGEWVINEAEVDTLREIRRLVKAGISTTEIARIFNADIDKYPPKYAKHWTDGNVGAKMQSAFLFTGERPFKVEQDKWVNHKIVDPPFFSKDEVMEVRYLLKQKKRGGPRRDKEARQANFLLAGIGKCGDCGGKLYIQDFTPQGKPYTYYRCKDCSIRLARQKVDEATWEAYAKTVSNPQALKQAVVEEDFITNKTTSDLKALRDSCEKRLEEITEECRRFNYAWTRGRMDEEQYEQLGLEIEKEKLQVEADLRRAVNTLTLPDKRDEAIRRASEDLSQLVESIQLLKKVDEATGDLPVPTKPKDEYLDKVEEMIRNLPPPEPKTIDKILETKEGRLIDILQTTKLMDEKIAKLRGMSKRFPLGEDAKDAGFKISRKLLDDLVLAGGKITVNHQGVVINGLIKLGEDDFKQEIIGQASFG